MKKRRKKKNIWNRLLRLAVRWSFFIVAAFVGLSTLQVLGTRYVNPIVTVPIAIDWVVSGSDSKRKFETIEWRELDRIGPHLQRAVLAGEDQRFFKHRGFDMVELSHALDEAIAGRGVRGASTITMQTARTVFLWQGRHVSRKLLEAYYTFLLEVLWSKGRIIEVYLNTVHWGDRVWGARAAAAAYFKIEPIKLSKEQAAWLATILPNPQHWTPLKPTTYLKKRQRRIRNDMGQMPVAQ